MAPLFGNSWGVLSEIRIIASRIAEPGKLSIVCPGKGGVCAKLLGFHGVFLKESLNLNQQKGAE